MKRALIVILCLCVNTVVFAGNAKIGIVEILEPISSQDNYSVFATDGRIYEIDLRDSKLVEKAKKALEERREVKVQLSDNAGAEDLLEIRNNIVGIKLLSEEVPFVENAPISQAKFLYNEAILQNDYVSDFQDESRLLNMFYSQRTDTRMKSQCYNRAHVWSWELSFKYQNGKRVQTGKTWIFFTKRYIRKYKYKWWFHIAPYLTLNKEVRVMDRSFLSGPADLKTWSDTFIASKQECPIVTKYSDYENYPQSSDCYIMLSSVHYWQPYQLKAAETKQTEQMGWNKYELKKAYRNGIGFFSRPPKRD